MNDTLSENQTRAEDGNASQSAARIAAVVVTHNRLKLLKLCVESVSTFCVLGRHALLASGAEAKVGRRAVVRQLASTIQMDVTPFEILLDLREDKPGPEAGDPGELFAKYLEAVQRLVEFVDRLEATT